jgi:hypothetical protein
VRGRLGTFICHPPENILIAIQGRIKHDYLHRRQVTPGKVGKLGCIDEQVHRARILEHRLQLLRRRRSGKRCCAAAGADRAEIGQRIAHRAGAKNGDRLPFLQPIALHLRGDPLDQRCNL